ncbi:MAG: hypothetical protein P1P93_04160 [Gammaproteobacteria bacterium]|nr:hypothetical protein [Gammaproteobacteria bacterium]MDT8371695.1 hypothetical protein [Gammaproteobacteria bacterium]
MTLQSAENHLLSSWMQGSIGSETSRYRWNPAFAGMSASSNLTANSMTTGIYPSDLKMRAAFAVRGELVEP